MIVLEIATIGEIEFLEFATLSEIRDSFTVYKTQPVDRGRPRYQLTTLSVSQSRRVMSSAVSASAPGVPDITRSFEQCARDALVSLVFKRQYAALCGARDTAQAKAAKEKLRANQTHLHARTLHITS